MGKLSSRKPVPNAQKVWDHCHIRATWGHISTRVGQEATEVRGKLLPETLLRFPEKGMGEGRKANVSKDWIIRIR